MNSLPYDSVVPSYKPSHTASTAQGLSDLSFSGVSSSFSPSKKPQPVPLHSSSTIEQKALRYDALEAACSHAVMHAFPEFMRFLDKDKGIALPDVLHSIANAGAAIRKENEALKKRLQDFRDGFRRLTSSCAGELKRQWERMDLLLRDNIQVNQSIEEAAVKLATYQEKERLPRVNMPYLSGSLPPLALTSPASPGFRHIAYTPVAGAYGEQGAALTQSLSPAPKYGKPLFRFPSTSADGKGEEEEEATKPSVGQHIVFSPSSSPHHDASKATPFEKEEELQQAQLRVEELQGEVDGLRRALEVEVADGDKVRLERNKWKKDYFTAQKTVGKKESIIRKLQGLLKELVKTSKRRLEQSAVPPKLFQQGSEKDIMLWKRREKERQWNEVVNKGKRRLEDILSDAEALLSGLDSDRSDASEEEQDASGEGRGGSATPPLRRKSTASPPPPTGLRRSSAAAVPSQRRHGLPLAAAGRPPPPPSTSAVSLGWRFLRFAVRYTQQRLRPSAMNAVANTLTRTLNRSRRRTQRRSMLYKAGSSSPSAGASPSSSMSALHGDASAMMSRSAASLSPLRVSTASAASNASPGARLHGDASAVLQPLPEVGSDEDSDNGETAATAFRDGVGEGGPSLQSPLKGSWDMAPTTWRRWRKTMKQRLSISRQFDFEVEEQRLKYYQQSIQEKPRLVKEFEWRSSFDVLSRARRFASLSESLLRAVVNACDLVTFPETAHLIRQGERGSRMFIVIQGEVALTFSRNPMDLLEPTRVLTRRFGGDVVGEMALKTDARRAFSAVASSTTVKCLSLSRENYESLMTSTEVAQSRLLVEKALGLNFSIAW